MDIHRAGSRPSRRGPAEYFTGAVRLDPVIEAPDPARVRALTVTFEPGATPPGTPIRWARPCSSPKERGLHSARADLSKTSAPAT